MRIPLYDEYTHNKSALSHNTTRIIGWEHLATVCGVGVIGYLLIRVGGGFPPAAWRELARYIAGEKLTSMFGPVLIQSFLYLIAWLLLLLISLTMLRPAYLPGQESHQANQAHTVSQLAQQAARLSTVNHTGGRVEVLSLQAASSHEANTPIPFRLHRELTTSRGQSCRGNGLILNGTFLCYPGQHRRHEESEDAVLMASGLYRPHKHLTLPFSLIIMVDGITNERMRQTVGRICVQTTSTYLLNTLAEKALTSTAELQCLLGKSIQHMNSTLYTYARERVMNHSAAMTVVFTLGNTAYFAHVGNNWAYHYRPQQGVAHITRTRHRTVADAVSSGRRSRTGDAGANVFDESCQTLGSQAKIHVVTDMLQLQSGDLLLLCSTGLWKRVTQTDLLRLLVQKTRAKQATTTDLCLELRQAALTTAAKEPISIFVAQAGRF